MVAHFKKILRFLAIFSLRTAHASYVFPCGDPDVVGDCFLNCHMSCEERNANLAGMTAEQLATQKNLCDSKCNGFIYSPLREIGNGSFLEPSYSEVSQCLGLCAYPPSKFCLEGYLSQYFYCECHSCCLQNQDQFARAKCAQACHLWFMKQWSPKRGESCRYRADYKFAPNDWCSTFCVWQQIKIKPATTKSDVDALISNPPAICIKKCSSLLAGGVPLDFDSTSTCNQPLRCVSAHITRFHILTSLRDTDVSPFFKLFIVNGKPFFYQNDKSRFTVKVYSFKQAFTHSIKNAIPEAILNMRSNNINITLKPGRDIMQFTNRQSYISETREERVIEELLRKSYLKQTTQGPVETVISEVLQMSVNITYRACSEWNTSLYKTQIFEIPVDYEVHIRFTDASGGLAFTGLDMKTLVAQEPQIVAGLQKVQDVDDFTIDYKWVGKMDLTLSLMYKTTTTGGECEDIAGCTTRGTGPDCSSSLPSSFSFQEYQGEAYGVITKLDRSFEYRY